MLPRALAMTSRRFYEAYKRLEGEQAGNDGVPCEGGKDADAWAVPPLEVLTEEEARRIIWPDSPEPPSREDEEGAEELPPLDIGGGEPEEAREKFLAADGLFTEGKVLSVVETKQLTVEHDVYLGMHREGGKVEGCV